MEAFEAFCDEGRSGDGRYAVFSFVGFERAQIGRARDILARVKASFGVPAEARLHCRELFSGHARQKTAWRVLSPKQPVEVCRNLSTELLQLRPLWSYGYVDLHTVADAPKPLVMKGEFQTSGTRYSMPFGVDQAHRFAYLAAGWPFRQRFAGSVRYWVDQNTTRIHWLNGTRGQAHNLNPIPPCSADVPDELRPLLEVADLFCYAAARCVSADKRFGQSTFAAMHRRYGPMVSNVSLDPSSFDPSVDRAEWLKSKGISEGA